jgi:O-antigen/teichoic acid export membrane protein
VSQVRLNVVANMAGSGWAVLISLAFVPVYLHFLGMEAYGLIGIFLSAVAILSLLDLGLGTVINRELARLSVQAGSAQQMRDMVRTLEVVYWVMGVVIGLVFAALAPFVAMHWVQAQQLSQEAVERAFVIMGIAIAFQWPLTLYSGGLSGLQRQVMLNTMSAVILTIRSAGAAVVLWQVSNTIEAFMAWQVAVNLLQTLVTGVALWRSLPPPNAADRFKLSLLREVWRFAAGMTGISVMAVILTQLDKVILSKVLTLEAFGYYTLAWRVAVGLYYLAGPVSAAFFPRFSQLAALDDQQELARLYHRSCQFMSVMVLPVTVVLAVFPTEFLLLWTTNAEIAERTHTLLALLLIGTAINGLMTLPLALQLAHGWTRLVFIINTVAVIVLAPMIYFMSLRYGGIGAAWVWIILNCGYVIIMLQMMHRRLLPGHLREWFLVDVGMPLVAALSVAVLWRQTIGLDGPYGWMLFKLAVVSLLTAISAALAAPQIRALVAQHVPGRWQRSGGT